MIEVEDQFPDDIEDGIQGAEAEAPVFSVLVVEDDRVVRKIMVDIIEDMGIVVAECGDGKEALQRLQQQHFDVVISDLVMPQMSGMLLLHSILELGIQIPFIFVTGCSDKDSAIQALRLGAFDYLEKPFQSEDLVSIVKEALRVSREQQALIDSVQRQRSFPSLESLDSNDFDHEIDSQEAEIKIMKMRMFRFKGEIAGPAIAQGNSLSWKELKDLFVQESLAQMVFCESAAQGLLASTDRHSDIVFMQRVIQSLRMASAAIRLNDIAEFGWSLETCLAGLKLRATLLSATEAKLIGDAVSCLKQRVDNLGDERTNAVQAQLEALSSTFSYDRQDQDDQNRKS